MRIVPRWMEQLRKQQMSCVRPDYDHTLSLEGELLYSVHLVMSRQHTSWLNSVLQRVLCLMQSCWQPVPVELKPDYWPVCNCCDYPGVSRALLSAGLLMK